MRTYLCIQVTAQTHLLRQGVNVLPCNEIPARVHTRTLPLVHACMGKSLPERKISGVCYAEETYG